MQQHKIVSIVVFIFILLVALNYTRNIIKNKRTEEAKKQKELESIKKLQEFQKLLKLEEIYRTKIYNQMFKEYSDTCYQLYIFSIKFVEEKKEASTNITLKSLENRPTVHPGHSLKLKKPKEKSPNINVNKGSTEPVIYLFVLVLIYSLITAASEISQHYKRKMEKKEDNGRRCSLREFAGVPQKSTLERRLSKGVSGGQSGLGTPTNATAATLTQRHPHLGSEQFKSVCNSIDSGIMDLNKRNSILSKVLLDRRQSVPELRRSSISTKELLDMDSPRKRSRMINRH